jgi:hypothetical protein
MDSTTVQILVCFALFVLVVTLVLVALMLAVPMLTQGPTYSGYY